ncbi:hypothetical protein C0416_04625 [bacterium]|nr:hypothetical protein [bacterium]
MKNLFKKMSGSLKLFILIVFIYAIFGIFNQPLIMKSLHTFIKLLKEVIPILVIVFSLMFLTNMLITSKKISDSLSRKLGIKGYFLAIALGILSAGPIYMWYPLLSDLKEKGLNNSLITIFLYNRAVKIPLIPMMIYYFGFNYVFILGCLMIIFSVINGLIVEKLLLTQKI